MTDIKVATKHETNINRIKWIAIIFFIIIILVYFIRFWGWPISNQTNEWGQFGDFVGGLLNPVFSLMVIWILVYELSESKKVNSEVIQQQINSNTSLKRQIELATPKPQITCFVVLKEYWGPHENYKLVVCVRNIGQAECFNMLISHTFKDNLNNFIQYQRFDPGQEAELTISNESFLSLKHAQTSKAELPSFEILVQYYKNENTSYENNRITLKTIVDPFYLLGIPVK